MTKLQPINWLNLLSCSDHLAFPAFFNPAAGPVAAYLAQLQQTQFMPGREMFRRQLMQLSLRMQHAQRHSAFYAPLLKNVAFSDPNAVMRAFRSLPILTRDVLQDQADTLFTKSPPRHGKVDDKITSGSTGQPVKVRVTAAAFALRAALTLRAHSWQGIDFKGRMAALRVQVTDAQGEPTVKEGDNWGDSVFATGKSGAMSSSLPVQKQLDWLRKFDPDYLLTYPSNLQALLQAGRDGKPPRLKLLSTLGETVTSELRELAQEIWQIPIFDRYSSEELGMIAVECPAGQFHLMAENLIVEILSDDGQLCRPGEVGRVVSTDLQNFATALLRYETRDYAEVGTPCTCGLRLPTLKRIMGRVRNMVTRPDGSRMWPKLGLRYVREVAPVKQYQVIQTSLQEIEVRLRAERLLTKSEEDAIRTRVSKAFGPEFSLKLVYFDQELPKGKNGKFEEFKSEIEA